MVLRTKFYNDPFGRHIAHDMSAWNSDGLAKHRRIADKIVARVTPYADAWSAMSDPLLKRWLRMRLDVRLMKNYDPMPDDEFEKELVRSEELRARLADDGYAAFFTPMTITSIKRRWDWRRTEEAAKAEGVSWNTSTPVHEWLGACINYERILLKDGRRKCAQVS